MIRLSPSVLAADFSRLGSEIKAAADAGAEYIHLDVMDGMFVPSISIGASVIKSVRKYTDRVFDVHLMIREPIRYLKDMADAGADIITVHAEACMDLKETVDEIKKLGCKAGVVISPGTPVYVIEHIIEKVQMILIMGVKPGFGGQKYIPETTRRIKEVRKLVNEKNPDANVEVDGGVTLGNIREILDAGADVIVAGSAIFRENAGDIAGNTEKFLKIFREYKGGD